MVEPGARAQDVVTVILGGGRGTRLEPLTWLRSKPAVPIAGKYRLIDIPISNALHSGMDRVFVLTQFNSVSLNRHIAGTYRFDPFSRGFVQVLAAQQTPDDENWFQGTADAVRQNRRFLMDTPGDLVLILSGDHMYRMDYRALLREHLAKQADVTIAVLPCNTQDIAGFGAVRVDPSGRVTEFREKPATDEARAGMEVDPALLARFGVRSGGPYLASMGIYLFSKQVLDRVLDRGHDFGRHILPSLVGEGRLQAMVFDGYWRDIGTIGAFYDAHMDLVAPDPPFDFYDPDWTFYTRPRFLPGTTLHGGSFDQALIADGGRIEHSTIERSVIGIRSRIRHATIRGSLLMGIDVDPPDVPPGSPPLGIGEGTVIERAIVDKNARIGRNVRLVNTKGLEEADGDGWAIRDGIVVVVKNAVIPDGTAI
jgi:glucose-1-phosphate adenylyltransferase